MIFRPEQTQRALSIIHAISPDDFPVDDQFPELEEYIDAANSPERDAELKQIIEDYIGRPI